MLALAFPAGTNVRRRSGATDDVEAQVSFTREAEGEDMTVPVGSLSSGFIRSTSRYRRGLKVSVVHRTSKVRRSTRRLRVQHLPLTCTCGKDFNDAVAGAGHY
jgi:hypothetical protein